MATVYRTVYPRAYARAFLRESVRADGRAPSRARKWTVLSGTNVLAQEQVYGAALVRVGTTAIIAGITAEIAEPKEDAPEEGYLVVNVELVPMASPRYRPGPPSSAAQVLSQRISNVLHSSGIVRLNQLAVAPGKAVWVLFVDLVCLNSDGSLFDAGLAAAVAALRDEDGRRLSPVRLPKSRYDPELRQVFVSAERPIPLALGALPAAATFVRLDDTLLLDPTDDEEALADAVATAVARPDGQLLAYFQTSGARPLSAQHTEQIGAAAVARAVEFAALVQAAAQ